MMTLPTVPEHRSLQSAVPSASVSVSAMPQPHWPVAVFGGSLGQPSTQSSVPSLSVSVSAVAQPHTPGSVLDVLGHSSPVPEQPAQLAAVVALLRGAGVTELKLLELAFVSVQPAVARLAAVVVDRAATAVPSAQF